jgi:glycosyltransferase involved in cell wall biosynthesis
MSFVGFCCRPEGDGSPVRSEKARAWLARCSGVLGVSDASTVDGPRVCHIVESLDGGAIENWLVRALRQAAAAGYRCNWCFYCVVGRGGRLDAEARLLGAEVYYSVSSISQKLEFLSELRAFLRSRNVEVVHSHHDLLSGFYFLATMGLPIRRFIYVHNASQRLPVRASWKQNALAPLLKRVSVLLSHKNVAISKHTLAKFVGHPVRGRDSVVYLGIDTAAYRAEGPRADFRAELGVAPGTKVLLFVGRLVPEKNPLFLVDMLPHLMAKRRDVVVCVVGSGTLADDLTTRAESLGVARHLRILGFRSDVPALMQQSDVFVFTGDAKSPEGLGLVVVEAQAAGLRCLVTNAIPDDAVVVRALVTRMAVQEGAIAWAEAAARLLDSPLNDREAALQAVERSPFEAGRALSNLMAIYGQ